MVGVVVSLQEEEAMERPVVAALPVLLLGGRWVGLPWWNVVRRSLYFVS